MGSSFSLASAQGNTVVLLFYYMSVIILEIVTGSRVEVLSTGVQRMIQSSKEIMGNHSDADIYTTLKKTNMDPNETTKKLLNQGQCLQVYLFFTLLVLVLGVSKRRGNNTRFWGQPSCH